MTPQQGCGLLLLFLDQAPRVLPVVKEACEQHVLSNYVYEAVKYLVENKCELSVATIRCQLEYEGCGKHNSRWTFVGYDESRFLFDCMRSVVDGSLDDFLEKTKGKAKQ